MRRRQEGKKRKDTRMTKERRRIRIDISRRLLRGRVGDWGEENWEQGEKKKGERKGGRKKECWRASAAGRDET